MLSYLSSLIIPREHLHDNKKNMMRRRHGALLQCYRIRYSRHVPPAQPWRRFVLLRDNHVRWCRSQHQRKLKNVNANRRGLERWDRSKYAARGNSRDQNTLTWRYVPRVVLRGENRWCLPLGDPRPTEPLCQENSPRPSLRPPLAITELR